MNKKYLCLGGAVVLLLAAYVGADFFLGRIVVLGVNRFAPPITQTTVVLAGAHLSPLSGSGTLSGLTVGNPKGWHAQDAFTLEKVHVAIAPFSIFSDHIVVKEITIDHPVFTYETRVFSSNIGDLLNNIDSGGSSSPTPAASNGHPIKFEVKRFRIDGARVRLGVGPAAILLPMPPITLDDLGTAQGGITPDQLASAVVRSVLGGVVSATTHAAGAVGSTMGAAAGNALKGLFGSKSSSSQ